MAHDVTEYCRPSGSIFRDAPHRTVIPVAAAVEVLIHDDVGVRGIAAVRVVEKLPVDDVAEGRACRLAGTT